MTAGESFPKEELGDILSNTTEYPADRICGGGLCEDSDPKDRAVGERRRRCALKREHGEQGTNTDEKHGQSERRNDVGCTGKNCGERGRTMNFLS